jgi:TetR/AcrR family tetracycline transcriptional repressor
LKPALDRERILAVTLTLIDRDGVPALSMRELAKALDVFPTAIYWYVPNRNELIAGAVALALGGVSAGLSNRAESSWQERLRSLLTRFRAAVRKHPKLAPVISTELISNSPLDLPMLDHVVAALEDAGFEGAGLVDAFNVVIAAMCGFVTLELASPPEKDPHWAQAHRKRLAEIPRDDYPALNRHVARLKNKAFIVRWSSGTSKPMASSFAAWLDVIIGGLEALPR